MLDERTIMVAATLAQVLMAMLTLSLRRSQGQFAPGLGHWAAGLTVISLGWLATLIHDGRPDRVELAISNAFYLSGLALLGFGLLRFLRWPLKPAPWIAATALLYVAGIILSASPEQAPWRISMFMLQQLGIAVLATIAVRRNREEREQLGAHVVLAGMAVLAGAASIRAVLATTDLAQVRLLVGSPVVCSLVGAVSLSLFLASLGLILMTGERVQRRLQQLASRDSLTGLLTRGGFNQFAQQILATAKRDVKEVGFLMIDIDHFKVINDRYGHRVGDAVLTAVARRIDTQMREVDIISRYGGEEFAVLLPGSDAEQTHAVTERLRVAVASGSYAAGSQPLQGTISIGFASAKPEHASIEQLYVEADKALYQAKREGRNRVVAAMSGSASNVIAMTPAPIEPVAAPEAKP